MERPPAQATVPASITPAVNDLLVALCSVRANANTAPTCSDDQGGTYTLAGTSQWGGGAHTMSCFVRDALATSAVSHTVTVATGSNTSGNVVLVALSGMTKTGSTAIKQALGVEENGSGTTPAPSLGSAATTGNVTIGAVASSSNPVGQTAPTGWTERQDVGQNAPTTGLEVVTRDSGFTGTTVTWGASESSVFSALILELDASGAGGTTYTDTGTASVSMSSSGTGSVGSVDAGSAAVTLASTGTGSVGSTDAGTGTITVTASGADAAGSVDAGTATITVTTSGADAAGHVDAGTAAATLAASGTDAAGHADAGTAAVTLSASGADAAGHVDAGTAAVTVTASGSDSAGSVDSGTASITLAASGTDAYNAGGTEYTDTGTAAITPAASGSDTAGYTDAGTASATLATSGINYIGYTDAGTSTITLAASGTGNVTSTDAGTATLTLAAAGSDDLHVIDAGSASISITATGTSSFNRPGATSVTAPFGVSPLGLVRGSATTRTGHAGAVGRVSSNPVQNG